MARVINPACTGSPPLLAAAPEAIIDAVLGNERRVLLVGQPGIGKSTLLKIAVGDLEADGGEVQWGHEARIGYFAQDHRQGFEGRDATVEGWLTAACIGETVGAVRSRLGKVLFSGDEVEKKLASLSGGEAARLVFAGLAVDRPNVLVLDEPTSALDPRSTARIEELIDSLRRDYTLIIVTHNMQQAARVSDNTGFFAIPERTASFTIGFVFFNFLSPPITCLGQGTGSIFPLGISGQSIGLSCF